MVDQNELEELLVDWTLKREQGVELSAEELCCEQPQLIPKLKLMIADLKRMDWIEQESSDSIPSSVKGSAPPSRSTRLGSSSEIDTSHSSVTVKEFLQRLTDSGILPLKQIQQIEQSSRQANNGRSIAKTLVKQKHLTKYQARVLLEVKDQPLFLDRYMILNEIGSGGMGVVYQALHRKMDRVVAIKILPKAAVDTPEKVQRFHREVKAAARLEHPNIVTAFDAHESNGIHYLVMSYVSGCDLARLIKKRGPLSQAKALDLMTQAAQGLAHAHNKGIVHRDVKPGNLLLDEDGAVKVLDLGLARMETPFAEAGKTVSHDLTQSGVVMGTAAYLAPEQAADTREADGRSDVYSLGCTLFYLLTGHPPYQEETMMKTMIAHRDAEIPSIKKCRDGVSPGLDIVFQKMVAKKPEDRFQSMEEVILALKSIQPDDPEPEISVPVSDPMSGFLQSLEETGRFQETSRENVPSLSVSTRKETRNSSKKLSRNWIILGVLGTIVLLSGLLIQLRTPSGVLVLEMDQPELLGAVVKIDGQKRITIQTGEGEEEIEIKPDDKKHTLQITQAGFETFAKEFTFEGKSKKSIKVSLIPLPDPAADPFEEGLFGNLELANNVPKNTKQQEPNNNPDDVPGVQKGAPKPNIPIDPVELAKGAIPLPGEGDDPNYSLIFDGVDDYVEFGEDLRVAPDAPITMEAWVRIDGNTKWKYQTILRSRPHEFGLHNGKLKWQHAIKDRLYSGSSQGEVRAAHKSVKLGQVQHVATVWEGNAKGRSLKLFIDGKLTRLLELDAPLLFEKDSGRIYYLGVESVVKTPYCTVRGAIDEVRITAGARYQKDFTPATRFEADEQTLALFHFDEGEGRILKDSSGNGHHGKIFGATWVQSKTAEEAK